MSLNSFELSALKNNDIEPMTTCCRDLDCATCWLAKSLLVKDCISLHRSTHRVSSTCTMYSS